MADLKIFAEEIEESAGKQIEKIASHPAFADARIRIMPDVHAGKGCVCGFTADLGDKVVPNLIGVDIGCGVTAVELGGIEIDFEKLDKAVRTLVPSGKNVHVSPVAGYEGARKEADPRNCVSAKVRDAAEYFDRSLGSLGGGNHFISVEADSDGNKYLLIHTGSRNFGKTVCEYWQSVAEKNARGSAEFSEDEFERLFGFRPGRSVKTAEAASLLKEFCLAEGRRREIQALMSKAKAAAEKAEVSGNPELAYLTGADRDGYVRDMKVAQKWADFNRETITSRLVSAMGWRPVGGFSTVHNYLGEDNIIRKSAISAKLGEKVVIPMNMRDGSLICIGKGNADWNSSAPHGAGRLMSRSAARKSISVDDFRKSMAGVWSSSVCSETVDEAPMAYKPAESIKRQIADTVEIIGELKPLYNFKAAE